MAQATAKHQHQSSEECPTLYERGHLQIFRNSCGEVFVRDVQSGTTLRFSSYPANRGGLQFTTAHLVEPVQTNGMIGWRVGPR